MYLDIDAVLRGRPHSRSHLSGGCPYVWRQECSLATEIRDSISVLPRTHPIDGDGKALVRQRQSC